MHTSNILKIGYWKYWLALCLAPAVDICHYILELYKESRTLQCCLTLFFRYWSYRNVGGKRRVVWSRDLVLASRHLKTNSWCRSFVHGLGLSVGLEVISWLMGHSWSQSLVMAWTNDLGEYWANRGCLATKLAWSESSGKLEVKSHGKFWKIGLSCHMYNCTCAIVPWY